MPQTLLERLLASASARLRSNGNAYLSGDVTLQQGTNVSLTQLGQVITIDASLAALTRVRANASPYVSGDVTFVSGTNVTIVEDSTAKTLTINASGGGGSALPSPYTATLVTYDGIASSLLITGPSGAYTSADPPTIVIRGRENTDVTSDRNAGDVVVRGGDLVPGNLNGGSGGSGIVLGGDGATAGAGIVRGGLTTNEDGYAGGATLQGASGSDHTTLTNVNGGNVTATAGDGKGTGSGGNALVQAGFSPSGVGGVTEVVGGQGATGGYVVVRGGDTSGANATGGAAYLQGAGGAGTGAGGTCAIAGGAGGATGNGGALSLAGGASTGGTSKSGGAASLTGGEASGTTGTGGAAYVTGGAGTGTGGSAGIIGGAGATGGALYCVAGTSSGAATGGSSSFLGGSGGSTGDGGSVAVSGGASGGSGTSKAGGSATLQGGDGSGTTGAGGAGVVVGGNGTGTGGDVRLTPGGGAGSTFGRTRVTRGAFDLEESTAVAKQRSETCAPLTTATITPTLAYSYAMATSESVSITVIATADNGSTTGEVVKKAVFRRTTADSGGAATQQGGGSTFDASVTAFKLGHDVTISLNGNAIEVKVVAASSGSTLWAVGVSIVARTGPV